jgi:phosphatidylinositol alpha-1,6-mannosyltransferase
MIKKYNHIIITWNFPPKKGGMENLIYNIYKNTQTFSDVLVIAPKDLKNDNNVISPKKFYNIIFFMLFAVYAGIKYSKSQSILIGGSFLVAPVIWIVGKLKKCKKTCYVHGLDLTYKSTFYQLVLKLIIKRLDYIFANSKNTMNIAIKKGCKKNKISIIHPFISDNVFNKIKYSKDLKIFKKFLGVDSKKILLCVGRLTERKGIPPFIENCFRFLVEKDKDLLLLISGEEPLEALVHKEGEKNRIITLIDKYDLHKNVKLLGYTDFDTLIKLYNLCDIFIFPGINVPDDVEGFGMVAIEASIAGKMTVAFDVGGISDAVEHNVSGILIPELDYKLMRESLEYYLANFDERQNLEKKSIKRAHNFFNTRFFLKKWKKILSNLNE